MKFSSKTVIGLAAVLLLAVAVSTVSAQSSVPSIPVWFRGTVSVQDQPTPDGLMVFARINDYQTDTVVVEDGAYSFLKVAPDGTQYLGRTIRFYATFGEDEVEALETATYVSPDLNNPDSVTPTRSLFFSRLPNRPAPTPTPTPTVTPTLTPTPTPVLPIPGDPLVRNVALWVLAIGVLGLVVGVAALRLSGARR